MIEYDCVQGTEEWFMARLGVMTASNFDRILTPTGRPSSQQQDYMMELAAEWVLGEPQIMEPVGWMERGRIGEQEALDAYQFEYGKDIRKIGFVYMDETRLVGCSPDAWLDDEGCGIEIKVPKPSTHLRYLLGDEMPRDYRHQVQGSMLVTGAPCWYFLSYHTPIDQYGLPTHGRHLPPGLWKVPRDEAYIDTLLEQIEKCKVVLLDARARLAERFGIGGDDGK